MGSFWMEPKGDGQGLDPDSTQGWEGGISRLLGVVMGIQ